MLSGSGWGVLLGPRLVPLVGGTTAACPGTLGILEEPLGNSFISKCRLEDCRRPSLQFLFTFPLGFLLQGGTGVSLSLCEDSTSCLRNKYRKMRSDCLALM